LGDPSSGTSENSGFISPTALGPLRRHIYSKMQLYSHRDPFHPLSDISTIGSRRSAWPEWVSIAVLGCGRRSVRRSVAAWRPAPISPLPQNQYRTDISTWWMIAGRRGGQPGDFGWGECEILFCRVGIGPNGGNVIKRQFVSITFHWPQLLHRSSAINASSSYHSPLKV